MTDTPDVPKSTATPAQETAAASETPKNSTRKSVAMGAAAVGIGSAAIVAALLYTRRR